MANVIITFKIMVNPDVNIDDLENTIIVKIEDYGADVGKVEIEKVAFGINALKIICIIDEAKGSIALENLIKEIGGVSSVDVVDVRRAFG